MYFYFKKLLHYTRQVFCWHLKLSSVLSILSSMAKLQHAALQLVGIFSACFPLREERRFFSSSVLLKPYLKLGHTGSLPAKLVCYAFYTLFDKQAVIIYYFTVVIYCSILIFYFVDFNPWQHIPSPTLRSNSRYFSSQGRMSTKIFSRDKSPTEMPAS